MLTSPQGLAPCRSLTWLSLKDNQLASLASLPPLPQLRVLNAGGNRLSSLEGVEQLRELQALILNDNLVDDTSRLGKLRELNTLVISNNQVSALSNAFLHLTKLAKLSMSNNTIASLGGAPRPLPARPPGDGHRAPGCGSEHSRRPARRCAAQVRRAGGAAGWPQPAGGAAC